MTTIAANKERDIRVFRAGDNVVGIQAPKAFFEDGLEQVREWEDNGDAIKSPSIYFYFEDDTCA